MVETDTHPLQGCFWFCLVFGEAVTHQAVLDWSPPVHIAQSRSLTREQNDPLICILSNCITPSSIISWVKPELPFHSYTARTKKSQMEGDVD